MNESNKKWWWAVEFAVLLVLVSVSLWLPKQETLFTKDKIEVAQSQSASYLRVVESTQLLMTSDKVVLPEAWTLASVTEGSGVHVLKLRSKQVRFVQNFSSSGVWSLREPASKASDFWILDSVKRVGMGGNVETLSVADIDTELTTPYVELSQGHNEFSVQYHLKSDRTRILRKKIRLISESTKI